MNKAVETQRELCSLPKFIQLKSGRAIIWFHAFRPYPFLNYSFPVDLMIFLSTNCDMTAAAAAAAKSLQSCPTLCLSGKESV